MLGQLASTLFAGIAFIIIARILGPNTYGIYTLALAVSGFFGAVGDFGIGTAFNKFISEYIARGKPLEIGHLIADGFAAVIIVGLVLALLTMLLSSFIAASVMHSASYSYIVDAVSLIVLFSLIYTPAYSALIGFGKGSYVAIVMIVQTLVQAVIGITLALYGFGALAPILGIISGFVLGIIMSAYFIYIKQNVRICMPSLARIKKLFNFSLPLAASNVLGAVANNFSLMFLGVYATAAVLGYIGVATRTISILGIITSSISLSILPMFSSTLATSIKRHIGRFYNYSLYVAFLLIVPVILFIAILSKPFTITVFGSSYGSAALFVAIIGIGTLIGLIGSYTSMLLVSASKVKKVLKYNAIIVAIEFALMPLFIIELKGIGFILLFYMVAPIISLALYVPAAYSMLHIKLRWRRFLYILIAGLISAALILPLIALLGYDYIMLLVLALVEQLIAYPAIISVTGAANRKDLTNIMELTSSIPLLGRIMGILARYAMLFSRN